MLLVAIVTGAKAATEQVKTVTKDTEYNGTCVTIGGDLFAQNQSNVEYVKYRTAKYSNTWVFTVKDGYKVTGISITGYSNNSGEGATIDMTSLQTDGTEQLDANVTFPISGTAEASYANIVKSGFEVTAGKSIVCTFDNSAITGDTNKKNNQIMAKIIITYEEDAGTKVATPTCTLGAWDAVNGKYAVTLNCTTAGHTIRYSTDNKVSYSDYSTALALAPGTTLDAYAVKEGMDNSDNMVQYTVPAAPVAVTGVTLNKNATTLTAGGNETLTATVAPNNATDKSVSWSSSDESVATVNSSGKITALAAGEATITVTTTDGGFEATCTVTVEAAPSGITPVANQTWDINSMFSGNVSSTTIKDNMEVITNQSLTVGSSEKTFPDNSKFKKYIQLKSGSSTPLHIQVVPNSIITVYVTGGSNKKIKVSKGSATAEAMMEESTTSTAINPSCIYTGSTNADIYISNSGSSHNLNVYAVKVEPAPREITLSSTDGKTKGFATFCGAKNFKVSGATAYKATINEDKIVLTTVGNADAVIPANNGIIIAGEKGATATVTFTNDEVTANMTGNSLKGTTARVATSTLKNAGTDKVVGFFKSSSAFKSYTGENFPANLAYFLLSATNVVQSFDIVFEGEATAINSIDANENANSAAPVKVIKNGKLYIGNYNVAGQQVK